MFARYVKALKMKACKVQAEMTEEEGQKMEKGERALIIKLGFRQGTCKNYLI